MAIVEGIERLMSFTARNRFGKNRFFGSSLFGDVKFGDSEIKVKFEEGREVVYSGVYSEKHLNNKNFFTRGHYYIPLNPRTDKQQQNRNLFAQCVFAWHDLTKEEKAVYNKRAKNKGYTGFNLFIKEYRKTLSL